MNKLLMGLWHLSFSVQHFGISQYYFNIFTSPLPSPCVSPMMTRTARSTPSSAMPQSCLQPSSNHQGLLVLIRIQSGWEEEVPVWEDTCSTGRRDKNSGSTLMLLWQKQILQMGIQAIPFLDRRANCIYIFTYIYKKNDIYTPTLYKNFYKKVM